MSLILRHLNLTPTKETIMKMKIKTLAVVAAFLAATSISSTSFASHNDCELIFQLLDTDHSGSISKAEAAAVPEFSDLWDTLDSNTDGVIDEGEFLRFCYGGASS